MRDRNLTSPLRLATATACLLVCAYGCQTPPKAPADATRLNQTRLAAALQIAEGRIDAGKFAEARRDLARFGDCNDTRLTAVRARIDLEEGDYAAALQKLDDPSAAGDPSATYQRLRGIALEGLGRWDEAATAYQRTWELDPSPEVLSAWIDALMLGGHADEARDMLRRVRDSAPGNPTLQAMSARLGGDRANHAETVRELETAALADPAARDTRARLAEAYTAGGRYADAAAIWRDLVASTKNRDERTRGQRRYAASLAAAGEFDAAREIYRTLLAAQPESESLRVSLAAVCLTAGRADEALQAVEPVLKSAPENTEARVLAALCHHRLNQTPAAVGVLVDARGDAAETEQVRKLLQRWQ